MKFFALLSFYFIANGLIAQSVNVSWGDGFKLTSGTTGLTVINTDKTGVYVKETKPKISKKLVVFRRPDYPLKDAGLIKLDKDLTQLFYKDYSKELKNKEFEEFYFIKNKLYLIASSFDKKTLLLTLYGVEIDKISGDISSDWKEITSWLQVDKNQAIDFNIGYNFDSSNMVIVSSELTSAKNNYQVRLFNDDLNSIYKSINIFNDYEKSVFRLVDVLYTNNNQVFVVAKIYEYVDAPKKKDKYYNFKNYNIRLYDSAGTQVSEVNTEIANKFLVNTKLAQLPNNELALAAFYSNDKNKKVIHGIMVQRINAKNGEIISTNQKEISYEMITGKVAKEQEKVSLLRGLFGSPKLLEDGDDLSNLQIQNIIATPDKGLVIIAEENVYRITSFTETVTGVNNIPSTKTTTYQTYQSKEIIVSKVDEKGSILWIKGVPKFQQERIAISKNTSFMRDLNAVNYFRDKTEFPFEIRHGLVYLNNKIHFIFNDHSDNANVTELGQTVTPTGTYEKEDCYMVSIDLTTGKTTRKSLFNNEDMPVAMPRFGILIGKEFYMTGIKYAKYVLWGNKNKAAVARVKFK